MEQSEERETMTKTMEQYMSKTGGDYESGVTRPAINQDTQFELKGQFLKELRDNTFSGSEHEDANKHIEKVLEIVDLFHILKITQDQIMLRAFLVSLTRAASRWLKNQPLGLITTWEGAIPSKTASYAKVAVKQMAEFSQKGHNRTSSRSRSTETSDGLAAIQAQINNLGREIKKVNEKSPWEGDCFRNYALVLCARYGVWTTSDTAYLKKSALVVEIDSTWSLGFVSVELGRLPNPLS
nr:hypothetical protein [Tanacetum cinerariifolium]